MEISGTVESLNTDTDTFVRSTENYVEIYGKLDERYVTEQTRIYVKVQGEGEDPVVYEAFPITAVMSGGKDRLWVSAIYQERFSASAGQGGDPDTE